MNDLNTIRSRNGEIERLEAENGRLREANTRLADKVSTEVDRLLAIARELSTANNINLYGSIDRLRNAYSEALAATPATGSEEAE